MPICPNCDKKWTWKQTLKTLFRLKCPYCDKKQYESASSRVSSGGIFMLIPLLILPINIWIEFTWITVLIVIFIQILLIFGLYPFVLKLSSEQEPYW